MTQQEKDEKAQQYKEKAIALLGHHMQVFECRWYGGHPVVQIAYYDYKVSIITRAELQQLMPEVEFASVIREFSTAAMLSELEEIMYDDDITINYQGENVKVYELCERLLYNADLSSRPIRYHQEEKECRLQSMAEWCA